MKIEVPDAEMDIKLGQTRAIVRIGLDEMKEAVAAYLTAHGFKVSRAEISFDHAGDYDTREVSGAQASIAVKISQV
jgi:hypothetical protein